MKASLGTIRYVVAVVVIAVALLTNSFGRIHTHIGGVWNYTQQVAYGWPLVFLDSIQEVEFDGNDTIINTAPTVFLWWNREPWALQQTRLYGLRFACNALWWAVAGISSSTLLLSLSRRDGRRGFSVRFLLLFQAMIAITIGLSDDW